MSSHIKVDFKTSEYNYFKKINSKYEIWEFYKNNMPTKLYLIGTIHDLLLKSDLKNIDKHASHLSSINMPPLYIHNLAYLMDKPYLNFCFYNAIKSSANVFKISKALLDKYNVFVKDNEILQYIQRNSSC